MIMQTLQFDRYGRIDLAKEKYIDIDTDINIDVNLHINMDGEISVDIDIDRKKIANRI